MDESQIRSQLHAELQALVQECSDLHRDAEHLFKATAEAAQLHMQRDWYRTANAVAAQCTGITVLPEPTGASGIIIQLEAVNNSRKVHCKMCEKTCRISSLQLEPKVDCGELFALVLSKPDLEQQVLFLIGGLLAISRKRPRSPTDGAD
eukprot:TRINITY_DN55477_c0_g1_i1.p1 TRINITY_DN55477_c0_g1~~TRINITY_DN55477_c0_g1_i1.p1  ORF type:complete len:156 (+),score=27.28 TRINITY_DN55477_c0_g1_i1:24-470(+)